MPDSDNDDIFSSSLAREKLEGLSLMYADTEF